MRHFLNRNFFFIFLIGVAIFAYRVELRKLEDSSVKIDATIKTARSSNMPIFMKNNIGTNNMLTKFVNLEILDNGELMVAFLARSGSGEDRIYYSIFNKDLKYWGDSKILVDTLMLSQMSNKPIKSINSHILFVDNRGISHLFVESNSTKFPLLTKIDHLISRDNAKTWEYKSELELRAFGNLGTSLIGKPIMLEDGFYITMNYNFLGSHPILAKFNIDGDLIDYKRLELETSNIYSKLKSYIIPPEERIVNPLLSAYSKDEIFLVFGDKRKDGRLGIRVSNDGGRSFVDSVTTDVRTQKTIPNIVNFGKNMLLVHVDRVSSGRETLRISVLRDELFLKISDLESADLGGQSESKISHPTTIVDDEYIDIAYIYGENQIKHIRMNSSFLMNPEEYLMSLEQGEKEPEVMDIPITQEEARE